MTSRLMIAEPSGWFVFRWKWQASAATFCEEMVQIEKIISGGQTGADRAALDFAIEHGIPHGGWCPKGRLAEDGRIAPRYHLQETESTRNLQRTARNVQQSDGTVVVSNGAVLSGGSRKTVSLAHLYGKPVLHISQAATPDPAQALTDFVRSNEIKILNVAGPRASEEPEVGAFTASLLTALL